MAIDVSYDAIDLLKWIVVLNAGALVPFIIYLNRNPKLFVFIVSKCLRFYAGFTVRSIHPKECKHPITYIERGTPSKLRPSLLFVHGYTAHKDHIVQIAMNLPSNHHIIAVDLPGHGESVIDESDFKDVGIEYYVHSLKQFVDAVGLNQEKFHLMGESMGGHIVGCYSASYPQDLATVSMLCPHGVDFDGWKEIKEEFWSTGYHVLLASTFEELKELVKRATHKQLPFPDIVVKALAQERKEREVFHRRLCEVLMSHPTDTCLERSLENIKVPAMLLFGEEDALLHVSSVDIIESKMSTLKKCVRLPDTGHTLTLECPEKVASHYLDFINTY